MAKAKKETQPKSAAKKPEAGKPAPAPQRLIDTAHVAEAAAAQIASGLPTSTTQPASTARESAAFKQLKESINKPASGMGNALDKSGLAGGKHSHLPFGHAGKQIGRNQTFGADVNRSGLPRRTGG